MQRQVIARQPSECTESKLRAFATIAAKAKGSNCRTSSEAQRERRRYYGSREAWPHCCCRPKDRLVATRSGFSAKQALLQRQRNSTLSLGIFTLRNLHAETVMHAHSFGKRLSYTDVQTSTLRLARITHVCKKF